MRGDIVAMFGVAIFTIVTFGVIQWALSGLVPLIPVFYESFCSAL
ncbi:hypothetical protein LCGC14_2264310 [marine sediment metagenome]|uniref:Uncharacterized protein n=1 Tax=marine sediment metagenome TaxID=412755 RepID=A0A0F9DL02_9ZZZZ